MARKGWDQLSANYRARLQKNGITKSKYAKGESIQAARGHSQTPERPTQSQNFPLYEAERDQLILKVVSKKHYFFSTAPKFNPIRASAVFKRKPTSLRNLRLWAGYTKEEWVNAIREAPDTIAYLGYH